MSSSTARLPGDPLIHETAIIDPSVRLGRDVSIGAYSIIGANTEIGDGSRIGPHVVIQGRAHIGRGNRIYQFASLGDEPQDKKYAGEESELFIGDGNTVREYCTINRGTADGGGRTVIGNNNWIMAYAHIAHDCNVGNDTILVNGASLAGHVEVGDYAILSAFVLAHQFCRIGRHSFAGPTAVLKHDLTPFTLASGNPAKTYSLNTKGLKRRGFSAELITALRHCYRQLVRKPRDGAGGKGGKNGESGPDLDQLAKRYPEVEEFIRFVQSSERGILR